MKIRTGVCGLLVGLCAWNSAPAANSDVVTTSVFAKKAPDYKRVAGEPEYYRLINGGMLRGTTRDSTQSGLKFDQLAPYIIEYLAKQDYLAGGEGERADLLIFVHWGRTISYAGMSHLAARDQLMGSIQNLQTMPGDVAIGAGQVINADGTVTTGSLLAPDLKKAEEERLADEVSAGLTTIDMFNKQREEANLWNARLLGYVDEINRTNGPARWAGAGTSYEDLIADIEEPRYYVILTAYDVEQTNGEGRPKLQWVTRISIRAQGNRFDDKLVAMLAAGARYYGKDSGKLVRRFERTPRVEIGEATVVGMASEAEVQRRDSGKSGRK